MYREKKGFSIPLSKWLRDELKPIFEKQVLTDNSFSSTYLNSDVVRRIWGQHQKSERDFAFELWAILMFEVWGRHWS